jgi:hypothetical protein
MAQFRYLLANFEIVSNGWIKVIFERQAFDTVFSPKSQSQHAKGRTQHNEKNAGQISIGVGHVFLHLTKILNPTRPLSALHNEHILILTMVGFPSVGGHVVM